jgi:hypothetical protein
MGNGLFNYNPIQKGEIICEYEGHFVLRDVYNSDAYDKSYLYQVNQDWGIDARLMVENIYGRSINDPIVYGKINAKFRVRRNTHTIEVVATRNIPGVSEIFASYGSHYWYNWYSYKLLSSKHRKIMYERGSRLTKWWIDQQNFSANGME